MYINSNSKIEKILGKLPVLQNPSCIFDKLVISFLDDISIAIKKSKLAFPYSDLKSFGFWCRKANLINISENYPKNQRLFMKVASVQSCRSYGQQCCCGDSHNVSGPQDDEWGSPEVLGLANGLRAMQAHVLCA